MSLATYFSKKEPKQLFVGAELCARAYLRWDKDPTAKRIVEVAQEAQEVFAFPAAGVALHQLWNKKDWKTIQSADISVIAEVVAQCTLCVQFVASKIFNSGMARSEKSPFTAVVLVADTVNDLSALYSAYYAKPSDESRYQPWMKPLASLMVTVLTGCKLINRPVACKASMLVFEAASFTTKIADYKSR